MKTVRRSAIEANHFDFLLIDSRYAVVKVCVSMGALRAITGRDDLPTYLMFQACRCELVKIAERKLAASGLSTDYILVIEVSDLCTGKQFALG